jgi:hypothetical protein
VDEEAAMSDPNRRPEDVYADILLGLFALAAVRRKHFLSPIARFHPMMVELQAAFPRVLPVFDSTHSGPRGFSETLSGAVRRTLAMGLETSASRREFEMTETRAWAVLLRLKEDLGDVFIRKLIPAADRLVDILKRNAPS